MDELNAERLVLLKKELANARSEIFNLRRAIRTMQSKEQRGLEEIQKKLSAWKCSECRERKSEAAQLAGGEGQSEEVGGGDADVGSSGTDAATDPETDPAVPGTSNLTGPPPPPRQDRVITLKPIGFISTQFSAKRALPRQTALCPQLLGRIVISKEVFTNPEHALEGLGDYSHMWIIFHFHRTESSGVPAKVSPPRLNGGKTGVFSTRSPHRPCPIGLSLVKIDHIQGSSIYFSGVDMLDGTPVLDIKPYIPQYDDPCELEAGLTGDSGGGGGAGEESLDVKHSPVPPGSPGTFPGAREDPDGEESDEDPAYIPPTPQVRVPSWVSSTSQKSIVMTSEAEAQLNNLGKADLKPVIEKILNEDPRSIYIKQKYSNQFYTFLISDLHISCKFDDAANVVHVYRICKATRLSQEPEEEAGGGEYLLRPEDE